MNFTELPRVGFRNRCHFEEPKRYTGLWVGIASAVVGAGTAVYSADQQRKNAHAALDASKGIASDIKYEPIDIEKLKAEATQAAIENATNSLAIERQLQPNIAATRDELARQVSEDLKLGGNLPTDVQNRVTTAGRVIGARSGVGTGSTTPVTAALLGISSIDLMNQRRAQAANLLTQNPLPVAGLDPGAIASFEVANNAANNQFNLEKAGVASNLASSEAAARSAQLGGQLGATSSLANLIGTGIGAYRQSTAGKGDAIGYDEYMKKYGPLPTYGTRTLAPATYTPVDTNYAF